MSVLSQAHSAASQSHRLEFMVKSAEELDTVMEELNACDSGTMLQNSVSRFGFNEKRIQLPAADMYLIFRFCIIRESSVAAQFIPSELHEKQST